MKKILLLSLISLAFSSPIFAAQVAIPVYSTSSPSEKLGEVVAKDTRFGLLLTPQLKDLPPGVHGFHIHEKPNCDEHGMAAGGHLDPLQTNKHLGPYNAHGHLGDLPVLIVNQQGVASLPVLAPRLKVQDIIGHSLMVHAGGDNYSDTPEKLGGGGVRIACGIIK